MSGKSREEIEAGDVDRVEKVLRRLLPPTPVARCPWCGEEMHPEKYPDHLEEEHYETDEKGMRTGPYAAGKPGK